MQAGYRLRAATELDLPGLADLERRAGAKFAEHGVPEALLDEATSDADLHAAWKADLLRLAVDAEDRAVGFALLVEKPWGAHLEEIDVDPDHDRRGIGSALLDEACALARRRGHDYLTLTTFADVPWNAPFYEGRGFRVLAAGERSAELDAQMDDEAGAGLDATRRVAMRRRVGWRRAASAWLWCGWLLSVVWLSVMASQRSKLLLGVVERLPGRDKTAHFLVMGGVAFGAVLALSGRRVAGVTFTPTGALCLAVAIVIAEETLQRWTPYRSFSLEDMAYSLAGVACFGALGIAWRSFRQRRRNGPHLLGAAQSPQR